MAKKLPMMSKLALLFSLDEPKAPKPFLLEVEGMVERALASSPSADFPEKPQQQPVRAAEFDPPKTPRRNSGGLRESLVNPGIHRQVNRSRGSSN